MRVPDVNVLVLAHRADAPEHAAHAAALVRLVEADEPFGLSELVLSGFVRVVTNPRAFTSPTLLDTALEFVSELVDQPNARLLRPGLEHFQIFERLLRESHATGKLVADAYHAALAIEHGCEWLTADADFQRFKGLRTRHPLA
ncbi:MAG: type II toxin-antitoxin system VapC family toxin [Myxococcaceae bacterium]|nr:type II toxin-antitoxin system VapC family toxin [Myxococcaceae bacterium]